MKFTSAKFSIAAIATAILLTGNFAKAGYLDGTITFADSAGATVVANTSITPIGAVTLADPDPSAIGDYAQIYADSATDIITFDTVTFGPPSVGVPMWSINDGGVVYTFTIDTISGGTFGLVTGASGTGTVTVSNGSYLPTTGVFSITSQTSNGTSFSFSASDTTSASVPDSGTTAVLISLGLIGIAVGVISQKRKLA